MNHRVDVTIPTVLRRVNSERLVVLGWPRAILMQLAHPLVAAGVADHSAFRGSAFQAAARLHQTVAAMLALSFGDESRRQAALDRIREIHRLVRGTLQEAAGPFPAGTAYSAEDPALLLWVHLTLLDSNADIYERVVAPLTTSERDALAGESAPLLVELGGDPATAPRTWIAALEQIDRVVGSGVLVVTPAARRLAEGVLAPRAAGVRLPLTGWQRRLTIGLLPPFLRQAYGFRWGAREEARFARTVRLVARARRLTPSVFARWTAAR